MARISALLAGFTALTLTCAAQAASPLEIKAAELRDAALTSPVAYHFVEELTTRYSARLAGSPREKAAAAWAAEELKALGFDKVSIESFPLVYWTRGEGSVEITGPFEHKLAAVALGGSGPTPAGGLEAEAGVFKTWREFLDTPKGGLTGKIAVVTEAMPRASDGSGYGLGSAIRTQGPREAAARGAVAFVLRSASTDEHRFPHAGTTGFDSMAGAIPSFSVSTPDASLIDRVAAHGTLKLKLFSTAGIRGMTTSQNVVAEITGSEHPEEIITIGGHLDSWDLGQGAIDDGAGDAIAVGTGKMILSAGRRPKRTVRVVLFGSEEVNQVAPGMHGGAAYAENRKAEVAHHIIASESDFGADVIYSFALPEATPVAFKYAAERVLGPLKIMASFSPIRDAGADVERLHEMGVPEFEFSQTGWEYFDTHHTPDDVLERIDPKKLNQNVAAWTALVWMIADSDVTFRGPAKAP